MLWDQSNKGLLLIPRHGGRPKKLLNHNHHLMLNDRPIPPEEEGREPIQTRSLILSQGPKSPLDLRRQDKSNQSSILHPLNSNLWVRPKSWANILGLGRPSQSEELPQLLPNSSRILHNPITTIPERPDSIPLTPDDNRSVEETGIPISLSNPLNLGFLPPKDLLLTEERVMH